MLLARKCKVHARLRRHVTVATRKSGTSTTPATVQEFSPLLMDQEKREFLDELIRVDFAGEFTLCSRITRRGVRSG